MRYRHVLDGAIKKGDLLVWPHKNIVEPAYGMIGFDIYPSDKLIVLRRVKPRSRKG